MIDFAQLSSGVAMTKRIGLDSLADRGNDFSSTCLHAAEPLALVRYLSLIDVMRRILLNQVSRYSDQGKR